jgi:WD40 repeat protein
MNELPRSNSVMWRWRWRGVSSCFLACAFASALGGCSGRPARPSPSAAGQPRPSGVFEEFGVLPSGAVVDEAVSGDGRMLITANRDAANPKTYLARVWDLATLKLVAGPLPCARLLFGLSFDGGRALTTSRNEVQVWDVATSELVWAMRVSDSEIRNARIDRGGTHVLTTAKGDKALQVWCVGKAVPCLSIENRDEPLYADFDPTGTRIVSCGLNLHIFSAESGQELVPEFKTGSARADIDHLGDNFDPAGRRFLVLTTWGARIIDAASGKTMLDISSKTVADRARWSADADSIVVIGTDGRAVVYDAGTGGLRQTLAADGIDDCHILPGGRWALVGREGKPLEVWGLADGRRVQTLSDYFILLRPVSLNVVTANAESKIAVWQLRTGLR